jgi:transcriptional regulator with PAS, ATPase and Fis domain
MFLGSDTFIEEHAPVVACVAEIPRAQRLAGRPALSDVVSGADDAAAIAQAYAAHGYTMAEIAVHLGVHYSTISRRVRAWEAAQGEDMRGYKT